MVVRKHETRDGFLFVFRSFRFQFRMLAKLFVPGPRNYETDPSVSYAYEKFGHSYETGTGNYETRK